MIRVCDIIFSFIGLLFFFPILTITFLSLMFETRSPLFVQKRLGKNKKIFFIIKFRTMPENTVSVASHLLSNASVTKFGRLLRTTKIDELPQLWNVLKGDMSLVGPRPGLPNQVELTEQRDKYKVFSVKPGITGLAQLSNIDMSTPNLLAKTDLKMIKKFSIKKYLQYIILTIIGKGIGDQIKHNK